MQCCMHRAVPAVVKGSMGCIHEPLFICQECTTHRHRKRLLQAILHDIPGEGASAAGKECNKMLLAPSTSTSCCQMVAECLAIISARPEAFDA